MSMTVRDLLSEQPCTRKGYPRSLRWRSAGRESVSSAITSKTPRGGERQPDDLRV